MAWHPASFADYVDASSAAIESDLVLGRFVSLGAGVPTVPHRCVPHGCVDQSTPSKKKVRCITDHTYPFGRPSTNAGTDLTLYPDTHLSSGIAVGRNMGIVRTAGAGSVLTKRDAVTLLPGGVQLGLGHTKACMDVLESPRWLIWTVLAWVVHVEYKSYDSKRARAPQNSFHLLGRC